MKAADAFARRPLRQHGDCLLWTGNVNARGYPRMCAEDTGLVYVHRWVWQQAHGDVPVGMQIDHTCHNADAACPGGDVCLHRRCVRADHLEAVPGAVNTSRAAVVARTGRCRRGHVVAGANTYVIRGRPICRICHLDRQHRYGARQAVARG